MSAPAPIADLELERAVLGWCLTKEDAFDAARAVLGDSGDGWFDDAHRRVWEAAVTVVDSGQGTDLVAVARVLRTQGRLDQVGGSVYLAALLDGPAIADVVPHARRLRDLAIARRVVALAHVALAEAPRDGQADPQSWARQKADDLQDAAAVAETQLEELDFDELLKATLDRVKARHRGDALVGSTPTGWRDVDRVLGGWEAQNLYIAAGRPGMGKTAFALDACTRVAQGGKAALFLGLEMPAEQVSLRALSSLTSLPVAALGRGQVRDQDWSTLVAATQTLSRLPLHVGFYPGQTIGQLRGAIRRRLRRLRQRHGPELELGIVVVDYLQLVRVVTRAGRSRENEVAEVSAGLKQLAADFRCPVVALSQLNRDLEKRADKRPMLADLRESGAIEQDAYAIMFLYRDEYYNKNSPDKGVVELIIAKHRQGPAKTVKLDFAAEFTRFDDYRDPSDHHAEFDAEGLALPPQHWSDPDG